MASPESRPQLTVRPARDADAQALREIFNEALDDDLATFETAPRSTEQQKLLILGGQLDPRHPVLVAEVRNWVCGYVAIDRHDERRTLDEIGEVAIFVRRSFRSYGVGRQLMRVVQTEAGRLSYRKLIGHVLADNHDSLRLCQATNWHTVGVYEEHARHGSRLRDVTVVEYLVPSAKPAEDLTDADYMRLALEEARASAERGEVPVGAVIVLDERILASAGNLTITSCDPTAHAEVVALRAAAKAVGNYRILGATLYATVEPCSMCAGAIIQARIRRVVYGCDDPKGGAARSCFRVFDHPALNHAVEVSGGVMAEECAAALQTFFAARRFL